MCLLQPVSSLVVVLYPTANIHSCAWQTHQSICISNNELWQLYFLWGVSKCTTESTINRPTWKAKYLLGSIHIQQSWGASTGWTNHFVLLGKCSMFMVGTGPDRRQKESVKEKSNVRWAHLYVDIMCCDLWRAGRICDCDTHMLNSTKWHQLAISVTMWNLQQ